MKPTSVEEPDEAPSLVRQSLRASLSWCTQGPLSLALHVQLFQCCDV